MTRSAGIDIEGSGLLDGLEGSARAERAELIGWLLEQRFTVEQPEDLEHLASRLGELAHDVAVPPVRLIKTIGDAVMLLCPDPVPLLDAMLDLVAAAENSQLPNSGWVSRVGRR